MAMPQLNGSPSSSKTSSTQAVSSLRPRTRRLISIDDEQDPSSASDHDGPSPFASRTASPIPSARLPRSSSTNRAAYQRSTSGLAPKQNNNTSPALSNIWGSPWSAIQGLASNMLGSNVESTVQGRRRRPLAATHRRSSSGAPKEWGPSGLSSSQIGTGSQEERENLVRAMKRKDLLTVDENAISDSLGRIKRRNSDEDLNASTNSVENESQDALIYIHHVHPDDTLAGISIKFGCQAAILRKANRMWPNDSVQIKKTIVIPVDSCSVKGRPVPGPNQADENLLIDDYFGKGPSNNTTSPADDGSRINGRHLHSKQSSNPPNPPSSSHSANEPELPWKHDSWVLLPNNSTPIEIGRMQRRALGFFPPARRKSLAYSDASTPTPSLDLPRSSTSTYQSNSPAISSQLNPRGGTNSPRPARQRNRSLSNFSLHGPGGVGTLGKNVRRPGPAQDGLNKLFAAHLPDVAPPPDQEYFTPWLPGLLEPDRSVQLSNSGARTPSAGVGIDLENIGGAIEGWMRKVASRASTILSEQTSNGNGNHRSGPPVIGAVGDDLGDLIELRDDAFEAENRSTTSSRREGHWSDNNLLAQPRPDHYQSSRADSSTALRGRERRNETRKTE